LFSRNYQLKTEKELFKTKTLESIGVLAGGIAHDFNNILPGILGNLELAWLHVATNDQRLPYSIQMPRKPLFGRPG